MICNYHYFPPGHFATAKTLHVMSCSGFRRARLRPSDGPRVYGLSIVPDEDIDELIEQLDADGRNGFE